MVFRFLIFITLVARPWGVVADPSILAGGIVMSESDLDAPPEYPAEKQFPPCPTEDGLVHFFGLSVEFTPKGGFSAGQCTSEQQEEIGNDINQLLMAYGIGPKGEGDDASFIARVCAHPLGEVGLVYKGGGTSRFCEDDTFHLRRMRKVDIGWFRDTYAPELQTVLRYGITQTVARKYVDCMGKRPQVSVTVSEVAPSDVDYGC